MSTTLRFDVTPDQASLEASPSRVSLVATLRRKTSTIFRRNAITMTAAATSAAANTPQPIQPESVKDKRGWFHSVGARFQRHDDAAPESSESSQEVLVELEESPGTVNPQSSPETSPSPLPSPGRRRLFISNRLRLHSLPARLRRRRTALFSRSSSLSDEDKENSPALNAPRPANASNAGSWSSFRSGVQRAVRDMVDGNFRFADDHGTRNTPSRPPARVPLRTLWTIMSADSAEGQNTQAMPPRKYRLCSPTWSPDWSPTSPTYVVMSPSDSGSGSGSGASDAGGLTHSGGSTPDSLSVSTVQSRSAASAGSSRESVRVFEDPVDEEEENLIGLLDGEGGDGSVSGVAMEMVDREGGGQEGGRDVVTPLVVGHPAGRV